MIAGGRVIVQSCVECPFAATDVDTVYGHSNFCQHPGRGRRFERGSNSYDLPPVPPLWCGLRAGPVLVELKSELNAGV